MKYHRVFAAVRCVALAGGVSCGGGEPTPATLVAAPEVLVLSDVQFRGTLYLSTEPSGGRLEWQVVQKPAWLTMATEEGIIDDRVVEVAVEVGGVDTLPAGDSWGTLNLISNGGTAQVQVLVSIQADPRPIFSSTTMAISETEDTGRVTLSNGGRGTLSWTLSSSVPWLTIEPASGWLESGQSVEVRTAASRTTLPVGTSQASLTLVSNARAGDVVLPVTVAVSAAPQAQASLGRLGFPGGTSQRVFWLRNFGRGTLNWQSSPSVPWLVLAPVSGQVAQGDSVSITATVDRDAVPSGGSGTLTITSDAINGPVTLPLLVTTVAGFEPGLTVLNHRIVDSEMSPGADLLVTVSADPARLHILDLVAGTQTDVPLALPPTAVALRPDGGFAAVGHNGSISLVDLRSASVSRVYAVTTDVYDLVLPSNGWMYAFPLEDQWVEIHSVELATGTERRTGTIYERPRVRLHPGGSAIYGATTRLSPSDIEKYDISVGAARPLYDSPYHGDYEFGGNLWITADGTRIFARSGNVFRASSVQSEDLRYAGSLSGSGLVIGVSDAAGDPRLFVLGEQTPTDLRVYQRSTLAFRGSAPLPAFPTASGTASGEGRFVFTSNSGDRVYVLTQANASAGLALDWGLVTVDSATLP